MTEEEVRAILETVDPQKQMPLDAIEELVAAFAQPEKHIDKKVAGVSEDGLRRQLETETDWKTRARIAARIISLNLE
jgi:uncharacterized protein (DUF2384 family)